MHVNKTFSSYTAKLLKQAKHCKKNCHYKKIINYIIKFDDEIWWRKYTRNTLENSHLQPVHLTAVTFTADPTLSSTLQRLHAAFSAFNGSCVLPFSVPRAGCFLFRPQWFVVVYVCVGNGVIEWYCVRELRVKTSSLKILMKC